MARGWAMAGGEKEMATHHCAAISQTKSYLLYIMNLENINNASATGAVALSTRNRNATMALTRCSASAVRLFKNET
jgi:hypothetical protein